MKARKERARRPAPTEAGRRALWALAAKISQRPGWRLGYVTMVADWTLAGWRANILVSFFFGNENPKGPGTVFSVSVAPVVPTTRWKSKLSRSAWYRTLLTNLGAGYRALPLKFRRKEHDVRASFVLRTGDVRKVAAELDRLATLLSGVPTRTTWVTGRRPTLLSLCEAIAMSGGPWRLNSLSFHHETRTRRAGLSWEVSRSVGASVLYEAKTFRGPGLMSILIISPSDWTPRTRRGWRPPSPRTERQLLRAGYEKRHEDEDRAATFIRLTAGLARRTAFRELERLELLGIS